MSAYAESYSYPQLAHEGAAEKGQQMTDDIMGRVCQCGWFTPDYVETDECMRCKMTFPLHAQTGLQSEHDNSRLGASKTDTDQIGAHNAEIETAAHLLMQNYNEALETIASLRAELAAMRPELPLAKGEEFQVCELWTGKCIARIYQGLSSSLNNRAGVWMEGDTIAEAKQRAWQAWKQRKVSR